MLYSTKELLVYFLIQDKRLSTQEDPRKAFFENIEAIAD